MRGQHRPQRYREVRSDLARSENPGAYTNTLRGNREIPWLALGDGPRVRVENRKSTSTMYDHGKSDRPIVPEKPPNKACGAPRAAEGVEERGLAKGNPGQFPRSRTLSRIFLKR